MFPVLFNGSRAPTFSVRPANRLTSLFERLVNDELLPMSSPAARPSLPLAMWEDEQFIFVQLDIPGVNEQDIDLSMHEGNLFIRGERKLERPQGGYDNRPYGEFEQVVSLPSAVDADRVNAKVENGVLSITFPKSETAKPRKIVLKQR